MVSRQRLERRAVPVCKSFGLLLFSSFEEFQDLMAHPDEEKRLRHHPTSANVSYKPVTCDILKRLRTTSTYCNCTSYLRRTGGYQIHNAWASIFGDRPQGRLHQTFDQYRMGARLLK
jgi:hypothetical protein